MKIILATGGSGGHIFPAIKVGAEALRHGHAVCLVGTLKYGKEISRCE